MIISEEVKQKITEEFESFKKQMYAGKSQAERDKLGQFFTPAEISIKMIERFEWDTLAGKTILDPTCGSGNLLAACLLAGADPDKVYGNEYDKTMVSACKDRLASLCRKYGLKQVPEYNIHHGDALEPYCLTTFGPEYSYEEPEPGDLFSSFF
jgi:type I restriction-modification system DNA methylase subunit